MPRDQVADDAAERDGKPRGGRLHRAPGPKASPAWCLGARVMVAVSVPCPNSPATNGVPDLPGVAAAGATEIVKPGCTLAANAAAGGAGLFIETARASSQT